jgi:hypothetical protein
MKNTLAQLKKITASLEKLTADNLEKSSSKKKLARGFSGINLEKVAHFMGAKAKKLNDNEYEFFYQNESYILTDNGGEVNVSKIELMPHSIPFTARGVVVKPEVLASRLAEYLSGGYDAIDWDFKG